MGKLIDVNDNCLRYVVSNMEDKKFDVALSQELLLANEWTITEDVYNGDNLVCFSPDKESVAVNEDLKWVGVFYNTNTNEWTYSDLYGKYPGVHNVAELEILFAQHGVVYQFDCPFVANDDLFPDTPWNRYVSVINAKVISLDNDKEAQHEYIERAYKRMADLRMFDINNVLSWYRSQMQIIGEPVHSILGFPVIPDYTNMRIDKDEVLSWVKKRLAEATAEKELLESQGKEVSDDLLKEIDALQIGLTVI